MIGMLWPLVAVSGQLALPATPVDPRIQIIPYNAGQVVTIAVAAGYAVVVDLGSEEHVESVVVGNSADWQVTASKRGDHVVIKPLSGAGATNLVVITGDKRYVFLLQPAAGELTPFVLRFSYPAAQPTTVTAGNLVAATFRFRGAKTLFPAAMSDDGRRTTIRWSPEATLPAVFAIDKVGREAIVNGRMVDGDYIVERIADRFEFRAGKQHASAQRRVARADR